MSAATPKPMITAPETRFNHRRPLVVNVVRNATAPRQTMDHQASAPENTAATSSVASGRLPPTPARLRPANAAPKAITVRGLNTVMKKLELAKWKCVATRCSRSSATGSPTVRGRWRMVVQPMITSPMPPIPRSHDSRRVTNSCTNDRPKAATAPNTESPSAAPIPVMKPATAPTVMERRMQSAAAGPTGTAMKKPMAAPSIASPIGLNTKPGTCIDRLDFLWREATRRREQSVLRCDQLQLTLAQRARHLQHGEDRRSRLAQRLGHVATFDPMSREQRRHRIARSVGGDVEADQGRADAPRA